MIPGAAAELGEIEADQKDEVCRQTKRARGQGPLARGSSTRCRHAPASSGPNCQAAWALAPSGQKTKRGVPQGPPSRPPKPKETTRLNHSSLQVVPRSSYNCT